MEETNEGLVLTDGKLRLMADFSPLIARTMPGKIGGEMLIKAAKPAKPSGDYSENEIQRPLAIDATAGLGEDSFLLAAAGYRVLMIEKNPVIAALLRDALNRGAKDETIAPIISRMNLIEGDSTEILTENTSTDSAVIYLDPMFPGRTKSGLIKKKFQLLQRLELPEENPEALFNAAKAAKPEKIIVKRPAKEAPITTTIKPTYVIPGKVIRYDCYFIANS